MTPEQLAQLSDDNLFAADKNGSEARTVGGFLRLCEWRSNDNACSPTGAPSEAWLNEVARRFYPALEYWIYDGT